MVFLKAEYFRLKGRSKDQRAEVRQDDLAELDPGLHRSHYLACGLQVLWDPRCHAVPRLGGSDTRMVDLL